MLRGVLLTRSFPSKRPRIWKTPGRTSLPRLPGRSAQPVEFGIMSNGFVALNRGQDTEQLLLKYPKAFLLLTQIALRARWSREPNPITRLEFGQAFIGDYKSAGLSTEQEYRTAKQVLGTTGQATFRGTSKGTVATLTDSAIWSVTKPGNNDQSNDPGTNQSTNKKRSINEQATTNHKENKETKKHRHRDSACLEDVLKEAKRIKMPSYLAQEFFQSMKSNDWTKNGEPVRSWKAMLDGFWKMRRNLP